MEHAYKHSIACCKIAPIISDEYEEKGKFKIIGGLKTYVTGPETAQKALLVVYDVFGYFPQTLQGADILSTSGLDHQYQVFMPDFFEGQPAEYSWYPPDTEEKKQALSAWFPSRTPSEIGAPRIPQILASIEEVYGKKTWGAVGAHPAFIDISDAAKITIPVCMLASRHEDEREVRAWEAALKVPSQVEIFANQTHGWMSARGDLRDEKVKAEYERGYRIFLGFLGRYM